MWPPEAQPILRWRGRELVGERQEEREKARRVPVRALAPSTADLYLADSLKEQQQQQPRQPWLKTQVLNLGVSLYLWYGIVLTFEQHFYLHLKYVVYLVCKNKFQKKFQICTYVPLWNMKEVMLKNVWQHFSIETYLLISIHISCILAVY